MKKTLRSSIKSISLLFLLTLFGCGKDGSSPPTTTLNLEVIAYQYQMALLEFSPGSLTDISYAGTINDQHVELTAISDSVLVFEVGSIDPGIYELVIDELESTHIELTVLATVLEDTPTALIETMLEEIQIIASDDPEINAAILTLNEVFNNASKDDQYVMAATYQANKELFDLLLSDLEANNGRTSSLTCATDLCRFEIAVYGIAVGSVLVYQANPIGVAVGLPVLLYSFKKAKKYHQAFLDAKIKVLDLSINEILTSGRTNSVIQLVVDQPYTISISSNKRSVNSSDNTSNNGFISSFFDIRTILISTIESVNSAIEFINENVPFADFELVDKPIVPATSTNATEDISNNNFSHYSFSIPYNGVSAAVSMHSAGKVNFTVSASNNVDLTNPIETELEIKYQDEYNEKISKYSITIVNESVNYFNYDNANYKIAKCFVDNLGEFDENNVNNVILALVSDGIEFSNEELIGIGNVIVFEFSTSSLNGLVNGTYSYSNDQVIAYTFTESSLFLNVDVEEVDDGIRIVNGTVIISGRSGNQITIDFDLKTRGNKSLKGNFTGRFQNVYF